MSTGVPTPREGEVDFDAIRARVDAATEGPWTVGADVPESVGIANAVWFGNVSPDLPGPLGEAGRDDAEFIAHARTDMPALLDLLAGVRTERDRLSAGVRELADTWDEQGIAFFTGTRPSDLLRALLGPADDGEVGS